MLSKQIHRPERSRIEISDSADADEYLDDAYGVSLRLRRRRTEPREGVLLSHARTSFGPFAVDEIYLAGEVGAAPDPMDAIVAVWPSAGNISSQCDGLTGDARAGDIALVSQPDRPHRASTEDLRATTVLLDPSVMAGVASGLPEGHAPMRIRFTDFRPVDAAAAKLWKDTVRFVATSLLADDAIATPLVIGQAGRMLAAVTLSTFPNAATAPPNPHDRTDAKPVLLRRAMDYIDANAANDIALADIAEAVHVTPRAVQYMFRRHLETTPLQYLRRLRLHHAHQELLAADHLHATVTEIAAKWGFAHTGRFAVLYRQTYGQSPHTTLRS